MITFKPVMSRPNRIRGDRGIVQRGGFLVIKQRGRKPQLRRISQRGGRGLSPNGCPQRSIKDEALAFGPDHDHDVARDE